MKRISIISNLIEFWTDFDSMLSQSVHSYIIFNHFILPLTILIHFSPIIIDIRVYVLVKNAIMYYSSSEMFEQTAKDKINSKLDKF